MFALVAGEDSGDQLGAELIAALRAIHPQARFVGVGGPRMREAGFESWYDISELSVMGVAEVLRHLPRLLRLRASLAKRLIALKPDIFIGVDAPDFNLGLEKKLKRLGIRTAHYVSPSIWAWREKRATKIGESADRVLCLFPMEPPIYERYGVDARFVGHPLADRFPLVSDREAARAELNLAQDAPVLAVLPGSRRSEIQRLGAIFLDAVARVRSEMPDLQIVIPAANGRCRREIEKLLESDAAGWGPAAGAQKSDAGASLKKPDNTARQESTDAERPNSQSPVPNPLLLSGQSHRAMAAADAVLLASGTAALEAMLAKRPMVVAYRISSLTYSIVRGLKLLKTDLYSLPNVLAAHRLVPELMQDDCTSENLATEVLRLLREPGRRALVVGAFERMHLSLHAGGGAAAAAARAVTELLPAERSRPGS
ncbi:MAG TPA: lipid-A-disaccharide synthase [Rhodanobacteraceae bacterium]|nr:lipid-A-disaccharide synthase [Rhodanobacteraceae bacterium]